MPGRVPKRNSERLRTNADSQNRTVTRTGKVRVPAARKDWHEVARRWYLSLRTSGQSDFYEPSDWAMAQLVASGASKLLTQTQFSSTLFAEVLHGMDLLLTTEAARRRARVEVQRTLSEVQEVPADLAGYRERLKGAQ